MSLRILHVLDHSLPLHSGYTFRTLSILKEQRKRGWQTVQLTSSKHYGAQADEETIDGWEFHRTRVPAEGWRTRPLLNQWAVIHDTAERLEAVVGRTRPDIIHAHSPCLNGLAALGVARRHGVPLVYEMRASWEDAAVDHGTTREGSLRYRLSRALETYTLRRADAVTTICEGLKADIALRGLAADAITVIPNAVDPAQFTWIDRPDPDLQQRLGLEGAVTLGFIGSFYGYEGLDTLLAAVPAIAAREPGIRVLLVGGGPEEARLREQAARLGIEHRVIFAGRVPHADVPRWYSVIDVLAYARKSIRLTETVTPLKPLEAMAQGRPFIASNVGGHRELVRDGETGVLFRPDDPDALAESFLRLAQAPEFARRLRDAGRRFVESERTWANSVARYESVYQKALDKVRPA